MNVGSTKRLTRLVYAYTTFCVVGAVAVFLTVAAWHFVLTRPLPPSVRPDASPGGAWVGGPHVGPRAGRARPHPPPPDRRLPIGPRLRPPPSPLSRPPTAVIIVVGGVLLVMVVAASYAFARRITRPLLALERAAKRYGGGDLGARAGIDTDDEFGAVGRAFDDMAERTARLIAAQNELMANVAHELRTPLARVRVALDILREQPELATAGGLSGIDGDVAELERITSDVLAALRVAMTNGLERLEDVDLADILDGVAHKFRRNHPDRALDLEIVHAPLVCPAEPQLIERAVENLLENAVKYSEGAIALRATRSAEGVSLAVSDHGIGIAKQDLPRVFEPFFRSDRSRHKATGGVGLGLNLVQRIVEAHGGTVGIESEVNRGTRVTLTLPRRRA